MKDAQILYDAKQYDGAAYLCGYAVEFTLKARICDTLKVQEYPEHVPAFKVHKLDTLLLLSGRSYITQNLAHFTLWSYVLVHWQPEMRYRAVGIVSRTDAQKLIETIRALLPLL